MTYNSCVYFSWGTTIEGKKLVLGWDYLRSDQYASLQALYETDVSMVFNPQDGSGFTYNVEIVELTGKYFRHLTDLSSVLRKDVQLTLLVMSKV